MPLHEVIIVIGKDEEFPEDCINLPDMSLRHGSPTKGLAMLAKNGPG
jgi:hypothetical protein